MSGRLVILPKKSYCPWKPENVERVLRDERRHREQQEAEQERQRQAESGARMRALKGDDAVAEPERFNLFADEEKAEQEALLKSKKQVPGVMPVYLSKPNKKRPFYLRDDPFAEQPVASDRDKRLKAELDPMSAFVSKQRAELPSSSTALVVRKEDESSTSSDESSRARRRKKAHKKERKRAKKEKSRIPSLEELRRKRLEREAAEQERVVRLEREASGRSRRYNNSFFPGLSKR